MVIVNAKARRAERRANNEALNSANSLLPHYSAFSKAMQYPYRLLARVTMRAGLMLVGAGDYLAGLALLLECYAAARGGL